MSDHQLDPNNPDDLKELERISAEIRKSMHKLTKVGEFQHFTGLLKEMSDIVKLECITAKDLDIVRMFQAQYALLSQLIGFAESETNYEKPNKRTKQPTKEQQ